MSAFVQTVVGSDSPPIGAIMEFGGNVEPSGWLFCFGQAISRTGIYAQLFGVIGTIHGAGDGSTTFNVPDIRGRVVAGRDDMGGSAANRLQTAWGVNGAVLGANGGNQSHQLTTAQLAAHAHDYQRAAAQAGTIGTGTAFLVNFITTTASAGGDQAHPNVQPTYIANKIIKYSMAGVVLPIVPGTGDVTGPSSSVDGDLAVFDGTSGKFIKSASRNLNRLPFCVGANGLAASTVGAAGLVHLDLLVPANLFAKDGDHIRVIGECSFAVNGNSKTLNCTFAGTSLFMSAGFNNVFMRNEWLIIRVSSTQFRLSMVSWRALVPPATGITETDRTVAVTVDWGQPQILRVSVSGAATNDVSVYTSLATFFPVP